MTEAQLWKRIRGRLRQNGSRAYRIEAVNTPGFPDAVWCPFYRSPLFLELKVGALKLRTSQKNFIREIYGAGLRVYVVYQKSPRGQILVYDGLQVVDWKDSFKGMDFDEWVTWHSAPTPLADEFDNE